MLAVHLWLYQCTLACSGYSFSALKNALVTNPVSVLFQVDKLAGIADEEELKAIADSASSRSQPPQPSTKSAATGGGRKVY